jgi:hypothetical protein
MGGCDLLKTLSRNLNLWKDGRTEGANSGNRHIFRSSFEILPNDVHIRILHLRHLPYLYTQAVVSTFSVFIKKYKILSSVILLLEMNKAYTCRQHSYRL